MERDHQDQTALGIEIDQNLRFQRDKNIIKKTAPKKLDHFIYYPLY